MNWKSVWNGKFTTGLMNVLFWCIFNSISVNKRYVSTHRNGWKWKYVPWSHHDFLSNSLATSLIEPHLVITPVRSGPNWTTVRYIEEGMKKCQNQGRLSKSSLNILLRLIEKVGPSLPDKKTRRHCKCLFMLSVFWSFGFWKNSERVF